MSSIAENWAAVQRRAAAAAEGAGRRATEVTVLAASKTFGPEVLREAYDAGVRQFGENYVQEALDKLPELPGDVCWHLIGHLQSNKARQVVGRFGLIHSVDSVHLAQEIDRQAAKRDIVQDVLLQVNIADEETKSGLAPEEACDALAEIAQLKHLYVRGLMTIGPMVTNPDDVRWVFAQLKELRDSAQSRLPDVPLRELSMGMTGDFETAIEEGATLVRVGRAIFGERTAR
ncbi:MAG: YggS family pyridoxal phosphate-dependent enzyme [Chloroflexi bacterium]|nr:YggS family pyridoxal phosphate-dependent enzyme [Chloroflexota bacterium]